jgi:hypothetical protein
MPISVQGDEYKTTYTINIIEDGSATWIIEDRIGLTTQSDEEALVRLRHQLDEVWQPEILICLLM